MALRIFYNLDTPLTEMSFPHENDTYLVNEIWPDLDLEKFPTLRSLLQPHLKPTRRLEGKQEESDCGKFANIGGQYLAIPEKLRAEFASRIKNQFFPLTEFPEEFLPLIAQINIGMTLKIMDALHNHKNTSMDQKEVLGLLLVAKIFDDSINYPETTKMLETKSFLFGKNGAGLNF